VGALRIPGGNLALALAVGAGRTLREEWRGSGVRRGIAAPPRSDGFAVAPRDFRPADPAMGRAVLNGAFLLGGASLAVGVPGDLWDRACPTRAFAEALHRFDWLPHLLAAGPDGAGEALRLVLAWRRVFGRWNAFSWAPEVMARRVFNLACAGPALTARASEAEAGLIAADLARQANDLLAPSSLAHAVERTVAAAVAGAALRGPGGRRLLNRALPRLSRTLPLTVGADGGHASRRPDLALELLFDLQTLDEAMVQRGFAAPEAVQRALDRLAGAVRFFTLADGGLAAFQGARAASPAYVAAARAQDEAGGRELPPELGGFQRMDARGLQVIVDVAPPAEGAWSQAACVHPLSIQVLVGGRRLIDAGGGRSISSASSVEVGEDPLGGPLTGVAAQVLGPRLDGQPIRIDAQRHEATGAAWLDLAHHAWMPQHGLLHQRRLFLDLVAAELRGEDRLTPTARAQGPDGRHFVPYALRFQLHPGVDALVSRDRRSVLLRAEGDNGGWILRNDALDIEIESADGPDRRSRQLVLRGQRRADSGARVRWKLSKAQAPPAAQTAQTPTTQVLGKLEV
jgi:uncharacterized heparinase superfamily protein